MWSHLAPKTGQVKFLVEGSGTVRGASAPCYLHKGLRDGQLLGCDPQDETPWGPEEEDWDGSAKDH